MISVYCLLLGERLKKEVDEEKEKRKGGSPRRAGKELAFRQLDRSELDDEKSETVVSNAVSDKSLVEFNY